MNENIKGPVPMNAAIAASGAQPEWCLNAPPERELEHPTTISSIYRHEYCCGEDHQNHT